MRGHASTLELKTSVTKKIKNLITGSKCIVNSYDKNQSFRAHKMQLLSFKKTLHVLLHYSINKNTLLGNFFTVCLRFL